MPWLEVARYPSHWPDPGSEPHGTTRGGPDPRAPAIPSTLLLHCRPPRPRGRPVLTQSWHKLAPGPPPGRCCEGPSPGGSSSLNPAQTKEPPWGLSCPAAPSTRLRSGLQTQTLQSWAWGFCDSSSRQTWWGRHALGARAGGLLGHCRAGLPSAGLRKAWRQLRAAARAMAVPAMSLPVHVALPCLPGRGACSQPAGPAPLAFLDPLSSPVATLNPSCSFLGLAPRIL